MRPRKGIYPCRGHHQYVYRVLTAWGSQGLPVPPHKPPAAYRIDESGTMYWGENMETYDTKEYRNYPRIYLNFNMYYESTK